MAFTPDNYLTSEAALDQIATEATTEQNRMDSGILHLVNAASRLSSMQTDWAPAASYIDTQAAAFPADEDWQRLKARKDKLQADFIAMKDRALAVRNAAQAAR